MQLVSLCFKITFGISFKNKIFLLFIAPLWSYEKYRVRELSKTNEILNIFIVINEQQNYDNKI